MDALWSVGLEGTYFAHPDHLIVQCCVCTTYLSPDTINQPGPQPYHYVKFFVCRMGYTSLGTQCNSIMAMIYQSNAAIPFVITVYLALKTALAN